jgi:nucleotide-binding universal stress UspA family protein
MKTSRFSSAERYETKRGISHWSNWDLPTITSVLVPLDFSSASLKAVEYALPLVEQFGAQLHLVHAFDFDYPASTLAAVPIVIPEADLARRAERRLKSLAKKCAPALPAENFHVVRGRAFQAICGLARKLTTDLIVTTTRGNTGVKHVFLGSTAERIVRHAPCPVLIVREREHEFLAARSNGKARRTLQLKKILVPVDFSDCSIAGLEFAIRFARPWQARLVLFHSVPLSGFAAYGEYGGRGLPDLNGYVHDLAHEQLADLTSILKRRGTETDAVVEVGPAAHQICDHAGAHEIDLIITSSHGSTGLTLALLGSTAEHVVRYATCPVLIVRNQTANT